MAEYQIPEIVSKITFQIDQIRDTIIYPRSQSCIKLLLNEFHDFAKNKVKPAQ